MKPYILCAAVWYFDNKSTYDNQPLNIKYGIVICGRRHSNCYEILKIINSNFSEFDIVAGFISSNNLFLNREEAAQMGWDANQLLNHITECPNYLISEMLYWGDDL